MYLSDSRQPRGPGILVLQYHPPSSAGSALGGTGTKPKYPVENRPSILCTRVEGRQDKGTLDQLGTYTSPNEYAGDLICSTMWPKKDRPIVGWTFAWPSVCLSGQQTTPTGKIFGLPVNEFFGTKTPDSKACKECPSIDNLGRVVSVQPLIGVDMDTRFQSMYALVPNPLKEESKKLIWPKFPPGYIGLTVSGTYEYEQIPLFFPTDPRLIAVNHGGDPDMGSLVCDLKGEDGDGDKNEIDLERTVPLQSLVWVIKQPSACKPVFPEKTNLLALNIGHTGCKKRRGGLFIDDPPEGEVPCVKGRRLGTFSHLLNGPLHAGSMSDDEKHRIGEDADKNKINAGHISTRAYFFQTYVYDAPLFFEGRVEPVIEHSEESMMVHLEYYEDVDNKPGDPIYHPFLCEKKRGEWRWRAEVPVGDEYGYSDGYTYTDPSGYALPAPVITPSPSPITYTK